MLVWVVWFGLLLEFLLLLLSLLLLLLLLFLLLLSFMLLSRSKNKKSVGAPHDSFGG